MSFTEIYSLDGQMYGVEKKSENRVKVVPVRPASGGFVPSGTGFWTSKHRLENEGAVVPVRPQV